MVVGECTTIVVYPSIHNDSSRNAAGDKTTFSEFESYQNPMIVYRWVKWRGNLRT